MKSSPQLFQHLTVRSRCQMSADRKPLPHALNLWQSGSMRWAQPLNPAAHGGPGQTCLHLICFALLQGVVWGYGTSDLCRSSSTAQCLLVLCIFMFLKVLALIRLGLKIYIKAGAH